MSRRNITYLALAFVATRVALLIFVSNPDSYPLSNAPFTADVDVVYHEVARQITSGAEPYTDFDLEYPPGVVPFLVLPENTWPGLGDYRMGFAYLMVGVDFLGLMAVLILARRWGSVTGPWMWVSLIALLGPLTYVRFDLIPAVATLWAVVAASSGNWPSAGGWLGFGAMTKVYPAFLLPLAIAGSPGRFRLRTLVTFTVVAAATAALVISLVGGSPGEIYRDALSSRLGEGVHLESTWGSLLLMAEQVGVSTPVHSYLSTIYFKGGASAFLEPVALILTVAVVALGTMCARTSEGNAATNFVNTSFATMALVLGFATTFSPQFVIWLIPLAAAALCIRHSTLGTAPWLLIPIVALTQFLYPYQYHLILARDWIGLGALAARNLLVIAAGGVAFATIIRGQGPEGPVPRALRYLSPRRSRAES